jgi:hypothetical protein
MDAVLRRARKAGSTVERAGNGHWKVTSPTGGCVQVAFSPGCSRGVLNAVTRLRRVGAL